MLKSNRKEPASAGGVLLISCYELGHQPLGLVVPGGVLERAGFRVAYNDIAVERLDENSAVTASIIGISVPMHTALRLGVRIAGRIRELNPSAHICFYGLYAELNAEYLLAHGADSCFGAEPEAGLLDLAHQIMGTSATVGPANVTRGEAPVPTEVPLDLTPVRTGLRSTAHYVQLDDGLRTRAVGYVATTRGCKHVCRHCPITPVYKGRFRAVPVDAVLGDVASLVNHGATHITFADPDFLNGPGHARRVARGIHERFPEVTFDYTAKVEHLAKHRPLVEALQEDGCLFVVTALESFNDVVLEHLAKGHTRTMALEVIHHFRRIGLTLRPTLVPFTPWETMDSLVSLFDTVAAEGMVDNIDPVQYSIRLLIPPGSALLGTPAMSPHVGTLNASSFSYAWIHPDRRMDALQRRIAGLAERGAEMEEGPADTFDAIRGAVCDAAGVREARGERVATRRDAGRVRPPRLTEAWFC